MDADLQIKTNPGCKELILKKLSYAVTCSVLTQIVLLTIFIFVVNTNVFNPAKWLMNSFSTLTSFTTWLFLVPFLSVTFAQSLICAKDYVLRTTCSSTMIARFFSTFSVRNVTLLGLHLFSGGFFVWLFLALSGPERRLFIKCRESEDYGNSRQVKECLNGECLFLILFGVWIGSYYFLRIYSKDKTIVFPVVQQKKLLRFQSNFVSILKSCQQDIVFPMVIYFMVYYFYGSNIVRFFIKNEEEIVAHGIFTFVYAWFFGTLFIFNMKLMKFFFEIFLTEPNEFPVVSLNNGEITLKDAMTVGYIPIIQHLACLDLFLLSTNSRSRRDIIFSLSQPGNHPHNWNALVETVLKLLNEYTRSMNESIAMVLSSDRDTKLEEKPQTTNQFVKNYNYGTMRNAALVNFEVPTEFVTVHPKSHTEGKSWELQIKFRNKLKSIVATIKKCTGISYLLEELPASNIQFLLSNGQIIAWTVQGLSALTVASLTEDKFGVVQKDLPVIISTLIELRQSIEKLNRNPVLARKNQKFDDYSNRMKANINSAVKRSLYQICNNFAPYLKDLPIDNNVLQVLHFYTHL